MINDATSAATSAAMQSANIGMVKKGLDLMKQEGAGALKLLDSAAGAAQGLKAPNPEGTGTNVDKMV